LSTGQHVDKLQTAAPTRASITHVLLFAILLALCIGLPALRRALGLVALFVLLLVLWAASHDEGDSAAKESRQGIDPPRRNRAEAPFLRGRKVSIPPRGTDRGAEARCARTETQDNPAMTGRLKMEMKMKALKMLLIASVIVVNGGFKLKDEPVVNEGCRVADPTGTPLNVRSAPRRGSILGALTNGTIVKVLEVRGDWVRIKPYNSPGKAGWVYVEHLDCAER
jgi:Bacterial SH3 domain